MQPSSAMRIVLFATICLSGVAYAQKPAATDGPGWTGLTDPKAIIDARESLMVAIERIMEPIDNVEVEPPKDAKDRAKVTSAAARIAELLPALPHLFPPTTNLYDASAKQPETLALPGIWKNWQNFYQLAGAAAAAAERLSQTSGSLEQLDEAGDALRATCDACHALYLRPYVPSKVGEDDLDFDFDSVLKKN